MLRWRPIWRLVGRNHERGGAPPKAFHNHTLKSFSSTSCSPPPPYQELKKLIDSVLDAALIATWGAFFGMRYTRRRVEIDTVEAISLSIPHYDVDGGYTFDEETTKSDKALGFLDYTSPFISYPMKALLCMSTITLAGFAVATEAIDFFLNLRSEQVAQEDKLLPDRILKCKLFTLVLDLNETLVHSDWTGEFVRGEKTFKRPGLDAFLKRVNDYGYEVVLYTDEFSVNVNLLHQRLSKNGRSFWYVQKRGSTIYQQGKHYRDLSSLNRDPSRILYVSGHALENCLQPENCVPIKPWNKEVDDTTLTDLLPFLESVACERPNDIRPILSSYKGKDIATEFIGCSKFPHRRMLEVKNSDGNLDVEAEAN